MARNRQFRFTGRFETHGTEVWAVCEGVPVFAAGRSAEDALHNVVEALEAYLDMLAAHGEIEAAVAMGSLDEVKAAAGRSGGQKRAQQLNDDSRFEATIPRAA